MKSERIFSTLVTGLVCFQLSAGFPQFSAGFSQLSAEDVNDYKITIKAEIPKYKVEAYQLSGKECKNTPFDIPITSINTYDTCAQLYVSANCQGDSFRQDPTDGEEGFNRQVASVGPCTYELSEKSNLFEMPSFSQLVPLGLRNIVQQAFRADEMWNSQSTEPTTTEPPTTEPPTTKPPTTTTETPQPTPEWDSWELQSTQRSFPQFKHWRRNYGDHPTNNWDVFEPSDTEKIDQPYNIIF